MYRSLIQPCLFALDAEKTHDTTLKLLRLSGKILPPAIAPESAPITVMGLRFPNRVGMAAGMDKNGQAIDGLALLGFGFLEIGTVTPRPQSGNPRPRLFRLPQAEAIINRMGFNNQGIDTLLRHVSTARYRGVLGINIGKNADTPIEHAADDYLLCMEKAYPAASYITINISSPNTKNLRQLQDAQALDTLLAQLKEKQAALSEYHKIYKPLVLKVAPDLEAGQITIIADTLRRHQIDGLIATNTTLNRDGVSGLPHADEAGGLSGAPLTRNALHIICRFADLLQGDIPIIASGGIMCARDAKDRLQAGASLVQLYSGLVYRGPRLVHQCIQAAV